MVNQSICADISARCGGSARIGVICADAKSAAEKFNGALCGGDCPAADCRVEFVEGSENISAAVIAAEGEADEKALASLRKRGVPFVVASASGADGAAEKCGAAVVCADINALTGADAEHILRELLFSFPAGGIDICIPAWVSSLPADNSAISELIQRVRACAEKISCVKELACLSELLGESRCWQPAAEVHINPATGRAKVTANIREGAFYDMLSETAGETISDESSLMAFAVEAAQARRNYDKIKDALECARATGYGIVAPADDDLALEKPSLVRQGANVGVKLKAAAPSYHIIKVDVAGEVSPIMGSAAQSEGMVNDIMNGFESDPAAMWNTNLFGRSLREMVQEGLAGKVNGMQEDTRAKLRKAVTRIVNEGKGGVICILL